MNYLQNWKGNRQGLVPLSLLLPEITLIWINKVLTLDTSLKAWKGKLAKTWKKKYTKNLKGNSLPVLMLNPIYSNETDVC